MAKKIELDKRQFIFEKTLELFAEKGYYGVSVGEIAVACDIARGSLYTYFNSKQDLVNELYIKWKTVLGTYLTKDLDILTGRDQHRKLWHNIFAFAQDHSIALFFLESQHHSSYLYEEAKQSEVGMKEFGIELYYSLLPEACKSRDKAQILLSISWGSFTQIAADMKAGRIQLNTETFDYIEGSIWKAVQNCP